MNAACWIFSLAAIIPVVDPIEACAQYTMHHEAVELKDRGGLTVLEITDFQLFRFAGDNYFPEFRCKIFNVSTDDLGKVGPLLVVRKKDGSVAEIEICKDCDFSALAGMDIVLPVSGFAYNFLTYESAEFALPRSWSSPEDKRYANDVAHGKKQAAEQRRLDIQAKMLRGKLSGICRDIYRTTIDLRITDLTVRDEQQVRTCQNAGLYPP